MQVRPIQIISLWNKFRGKFGWTVQQPEPIYLQPMVQPVTVVDDLLKEFVVEISGHVSITATGEFVMLTVPTKKRWWVHAIQVFKSSGVWTCQQIKVGDDTTLIPIVYESAQAQLITGAISPIPLEGGSRLAVYIDGWTSVGNAVMNAVVVEENIG